MPEPRDVVGGRAVNSPLPMRYRHHLTFRFEQSKASLIQRDGWISIDGYSVDVRMNNDAFEGARKQVKEQSAQKFGCDPDDVVLFLVNHTTATL
jgi:hypothetical protein